MTNFFMAPLLLGFIVFLFADVTSGQLGLPPDIASKLCNDSETINATAEDWGHIVHNYAAAVFNPNSTTDIATLLQFANNGSTRFGVAARGQGHFARGHPMVKGGIVLLTALNNLGSATIVIVSKGVMYADVGGEQTWIDVLRGTVAQGFLPVSWTDYLDLSVGGTLSNAGISCQTFRYGPQITNVYELDVVTGIIITCSPTQTSELFYSALGGLGQLGIITRARIALQAAPTKVPESVWSFLSEHGFGSNRGFGKYCSFVHLGGRSVCLLLSSQFSGPYNRSVSQWGEANRMGVAIVVFEFQVSEKRDSMDAEFVFQHAFEYFGTNIDARRSSKTSDAHMVGAFLV